MGYGTRKLSDEYEVSEILGRGGFSVVRKGTKKSSIEEEKSQSQVAIKTLRRLGASNNPSGLPRKKDIGEKSTIGFPTMRQVSVSDTLLTNEILVMRRIVENVSPHPNVIDLYDVYEDTNGVHLVLELCSGGELFDRIVAQDKYSETEAATVVHQIASGLEAVHRANIVHRDLKPENCLFLDVRKDSPLKIMDFGLSSVEEFTDPVVGLFGSIDYVSPEALSQGKITTKSDMWSLGVILYILLSGYPPFIAQNNRQKQQMIMNGNFSFYEKTWKGISQPAKNLISSLLTVDPSKRPSALELLSDPWVKGEKAKDVQMDPEIVSRLQSFNARRKLRAAAIASVWSSTIFLRTKKLKSLVGSYDLKEEEIENLRMHFKKICADRDNATLSEFEEVLKAMNMLSLIPFASRIFDLFDNNRDGTVDMREILCGFSSLKNSKGEDALRLCFQMYDTDRSGCISKEEVASMLRALPYDCLPTDITEPGKLDEIFDLMDANNDGKVTFDEFKAAMQRDSSLQDVVLSSIRP
ncbi:Calcium and calcium/calmodulin-dependent serine/threonine-protein kinase CAMK-CAMK1-DCAMKL family [Medicago truncatula]|uniref:Calcium and calcium/calmodulin-dependent serine/threonine-protein kinase DMI-3 n=16 Tax=Medicago truncatula TaxID=3880 RepID=CCAMK_MEDTR|nr:calcium and calcium/calmodulin-dependent serine/threonine-protein kinase DMI-3 [Medicago truncatula]Q6RET7.1 RecName: Full=Calcium and calcium/calmodulin-dependent serine/threonine-protein kinase DMI-3; AltName: Full=CCaMK DMI3; AltName: Full=MtCCaMK; AltName: Full=Protein DOES NOT MAKE INFECTIONS 3 [Medicago truncatula]AET75786.1 DMI3 [Cloning vector pHUGE-MtNFS]AET75798.1 DMI3 [Cloning vector pHUGE-LjMtNFS]AAS55541.1 Ca2+ and calmodulin-dependent protein kinase [Medicago truncatula]AAS751